MPVTPAIHHPVRAVLVAEGAAVAEVVLQLATLSALSLPSARGVYPAKEVLRAQAAARAAAEKALAVQEIRAVLAVQPRQEIPAPQATQALRPLAYLGLFRGVVRVMAAPLVERELAVLVVPAVRALR
jgi:hypothetical protein